MERRELRTVEKYKKAGAQARLIKYLMSRFILENSGLLFGEEQDTLIRIKKRFGAIVSRVEDRMFADHPKLPNAYLDVFYGTLGQASRTEVDEEIKKEVSRLLEENYVA